MLLPPTTPRLMCDGALLVLARGVVCLDPAQPLVQAAATWALLDAAVAAMAPRRAGWDPERWERWYQAMGGN